MAMTEIMPSAAQTTVIAALAGRIEAAAHGGKNALVKAVAAELDVSAATVMRWLAPYRAADRKRRSDAGAVALSRDDALRISTEMMAGISTHGKRRMTLANAVNILRQNIDGFATVSGADGGNAAPLSLSTIARGLKVHGVDPARMSAPAPVKRLASEHPNHCWELDASVCVVFYLPKSGGVALIDEREVYKNKPQNSAAIERFRVIRYVLTDHFSGLIVWRYYPGAESGDHSCDFLAWAMAQEAGHAPLHGRPRYVMVDPGATSSGKVKKFCRRMGIKLIVDAPHNARAKGQVENAQNLVETWFESGLSHKAREIKDFDTLNALAEKFQVYTNATRIHSRHGRTRSAMWQTIAAHELVSTAPYSRLRQLITGGEATPKVTPELAVRFDGRRFNARAVPGVVIGQPLTVCASPFAEAGAFAVVIGDDGRETLFPLDEIVTLPGGFDSNAAMIGEGYKAMPDTGSEIVKKEMLKAATGADTLEAAQKVSAKKDFAPFARVAPINPFKAVDDADGKIVFLPRAATPMPEALPEIAARLIPVVRAAKEMQAAWGDEWDAKTYEWLAQRWPEGIPEDELARLIACDNDNLRRVSI
jgi:hypothetical protein